MPSKLDSQPRAERDPDRAGGDDLLERCRSWVDLLPPDVESDFERVFLSVEWWKKESDIWQKRAETAKALSKEATAQALKAVKERKAAEAQVAKLREALRQMVEREVTGACALSLQFDALQALKDKSND